MLVRVKLEALIELPEGTAMPEQGRAFTLPNGDWVKPFITLEMNDGRDLTFKEMTAISVVPPPISITMVPTASCTGNPAPMAAAMGSSIRRTSLAPALMTDSRIARRSTSVAWHGTHTRTLGLGLIKLFWCTFLMKCWSIFSVT